MERIIRWDKLKNISLLTDKSEVIKEYQHREDMARHTGPMDNKAFEKWCKKYYTGYIAEKYVYDHCPEVKPLDPDWEYLCHMEHFGSHTYDCTYKGISADIKHCWNNDRAQHPKYIYVYAEKHNRVVSVDNLMHKATLVISNIGDNIAYAFTSNYKLVNIYGEYYYEFPIEKYIYKKNIV